MMNKLLSVFFCFLSTVVFAQDGKNYLDYYRSVALVEESIVNGKYQDAIKQYHAVFAEYPYNNPIDCYIAAQVSSYAGDTASCLNFIYQGVCFGLPVQATKANPHLAELFKKADQQVVDSCWSVYKKRIDTKARATMLSLIKTDQSFIRTLPLMGLYEADGYSLKNIYRPFYDSLVTELINLTRASGFPAQKVIGTQNGDDSLFKIGPNSVFATYIFIHHSNAWKQVGETLWTELLKGNITPQMYGVIYESSSGKGPYKTSINYFASRPCQDRLCKKLVKENLKEINASRWEIGLGSYEVMEKKFESRMQYFKWCRKETKKPEPFFDFQCDLSFQGK